MNPLTTTLLCLNAAVAANTYVPQTTTAPLIQPVTLTASATWANGDGTIGNGVSGAFLALTNFGG